MACEVEFTDEFGQWWDSLNIDEQASIDRIIGLLAEAGMALGFPYSSKIATSKFGSMRELRIQHQGRPYRVLYAFDPRRAGLLLIGGEKTGNDNWYEEFVPTADKIFEQHLKELKSKN